MRSSAFTFVAALLLAAILARGSFAARMSAAEPLGCDGQVVGLVDADGTTRLACPSDASLSGCASVRPGLRYRGCSPDGVVTGPMLALHGQPIEINAATADDLRALPNVGAGLSKRITAARAEAPFCSLDALARVQGLGPKRIAALEGCVTFESAGCPAAER
jgi:hypothetical protein